MNQIKFPAVKFLKLHSRESFAKILQTPCIARKCETGLTEFPVATNKMSYIFPITVYDYQTVEKTSEHESKRASSSNARISRQLNARQKQQIASLIREQHVGLIGHYLAYKDRNNVLIILSRDRFLFHLFPRYRLALMRCVVTRVAIDLQHAANSKSVVSSFSAFASGFLFWIVCFFVFFLFFK